MTLSLRSAVLVPILAISSAYAAAEPLPARAPITINDLASLKYVSDAIVSPDGEWIAYTVSRTDKEADKQRTQIFMTSKSGDQTLPMTGETYSATSPAWSPDGSYLSFLAARDDLDENASTQVWTLALQGGDAEPYTDVPQGIEAFEWAPAGDRMLLVIKDESDAAKSDREALESGEDPKPRPWVIDRLQFKEDGIGYLDRSYNHLYVSDGRKAAPQQMTFGSVDDSAPVWSPDGTRIAYVSNATLEPDGNYNTDIFTVAANPGSKPVQVTQSPGTEASPAWSPDGAQIAYTIAGDPSLIWYATIDLAISSADGTNPRVLTASLDRNVMSPEFSADGSRIYFTSEDNGEQPVSVISLADGTIEKLITGGVEVDGFDLADNGDIYAVVSRPDLPADVFRKSADELTAITHVNEEILSKVRLSIPQAITYPSSGDATVSGFVYPPFAMPKKGAPPAILRIHGGPVSQFTYGFNREAQLLAANGYSVININPRGSSGYGEEFSKAIFADWGNKDFEDVMAGVDAAISLGLADPDRLGVGGWSYGGILTNYVITKTGRFKAAISGASEAVYIANYGHDIYQREWELEIGLPWENREGWEKISPFNQIDKVTTPTLLMGGKEDWNVPILNSEQLFQALKRRGIDTGLVVYPDEDHSIGRPSFVDDRYQRYLDWYALYLK